MINGIEQPKYLRRSEAADFLCKMGVPCTRNTLAKMAVVGGGPLFRKLGSIPLYTPGDLEDWVASKLTKPVNSTAQLSSRAGGHRAAASVNA